MTQHHAIHPDAVAPAAGWKCWTGSEWVWQVGPVDVSRSRAAAAFREFKCRSGYVRQSFQPLGVESDEYGAGGCGQPQKCVRGAGLVTERKQLNLLDRREAIKRVCVEGINSSIPQPIADLDRVGSRQDDDSLLTTDRNVQCNPVLVGNDSDLCRADLGHSISSPVVVRTNTVARRGEVASLSPEGREQ